MFEFDVNALAERETEEYNQFIAAIEKAYEEGEDLSEYIWPDEWDYRIRPSNHHASHIISLIDAIDLCGNHLYNNNWKQDNWYARCPEKIQSWEIRNNFYRAMGSHGRQKGADFNNRPDEEKYAYDRKCYIYSKLTTWLNQRKIESFTIDDNGNTIDIPDNYWLSKYSIQMLDTGKYCLEGYEAYSKKQEFIYINLYQLNELLQNDNTIAGMSGNNTKLHNNSSPQESDFPNVIVDDKIEQNKNIANIKENELSPYIHLMIKCSRELYISQDSKTLKKTIENWLIENWQDDLGRKSDNLIKYMATLIRYPEHQIGGNSRYKK